MVIKAQHRPPDYVQVSDMQSEWLIQVNVQQGHSQAFKELPAGCWVPQIQAAGPLALWHEPLRANTCATACGSADRAAKATVYKALSSKYFLSILFEPSSNKIKTKQRKKFKL